MALIIVKCIILRRPEKIIKVNYKTRNQKQSDKNKFLSVFYDSNSNWKLGFLKLLLFYNCEKNFYLINCSDFLKYLKMILTLFDDAIYY